ncbi:MAG: hypothetical protein ACRCR1_09535 [Aeromonas sp.]
MSSQDLNDAIKSINQSASLANATSDFFEKVIAGDKYTTIKNPVDGSDTPTVQKMVYDQYSKDINQIQHDVADSEAAANRAEAAAGVVGPQVRESLRRSYAEAGFNLVDGSFELGGVLVNHNDVLLQSTTGKAFTGPAGIVPAGTNPSSGGFVDVSSRITVNFNSVNALKSSAGLLIGAVVRTGVTCWKIVSTGTSGSIPIAGNLAAMPLNGAWLDDWGVDVNGSIPVDSELSEALSIRRSVMLGQGKYRVNTKKTLLPGATVKGVSDNSVIDARMSDCLFEFPIETGRSVKVFRDLHVYSSGNEMFPNGVAFKFPGVAVGSDIKYTSGYKFENIEVGGGGSFGCCWDISDSFRITIRDCGYSSVLNPIRIRGSVVQCTIDNVTGNNNTYDSSYDGRNAGVWMENKTYSDGVKVPENVKILSSGFVTHCVGIRHSGLAIMIRDCDLDFIRDVGTDYGGGEGHSISGGYIAHSSKDFPFVGSRVTKANAMDDVSISGVTYATYAVFQSRHTAVQIGSGDASPYAEPSGPSVVGVKIIGFPGSWDFGVQADRCESVSIDDNFIKAGVIRSGGKAINASNTKSLSCCRNKCKNQEIYISAPDAVATVTATDNLARMVTQYMAPPAANLMIARNRVG